MFPVLIPSETDKPFKEVPAPLKVSSRMQSYVLSVRRFRRPAGEYGATGGGVSHQGWLLHPRRARCGDLLGLHRRGLRSKGLQGV